MAVSHRTSQPNAKRGRIKKSGSPHRLGVQGSWKFRHRTTEASRDATRIEISYRSTSENEFDIYVPGGGSYRVGEFPGLDRHLRELRERVKSERRALHLETGD